MKLERIDIRRMTYGPNKGDLEGYMEVSGETGKMTITLTPERAKQVVDLCADALVECAVEASRIVKSDLIEHHGAISITVNP